MISKQRSGCSGWAQQGSNLRPLGEQPPYDQGRSNPSDLAERRSAYDQSRLVSTPLVDAKWTADLGRRLAFHAASLALAALLYPAVAWVYRDERRKAGAR